MSGIRMTALSAGSGALATIALPNVQRCGVVWIMVEFWSRSNIARTVSSARSMASLPLLFRGRILTARLQESSIRRLPGSPSICLAAPLQHIRVSTGKPLETVFPEHCTTLNPSAPEGWTAWLISALMKPAAAGATSASQLSSTMTPTSCLGGRRTRPQSPGAVPQEPFARAACINQGCCRRRRPLDHGLRQQVHSRPRTPCRSVSRGRMGHGGAGRSQD